jgi:hypothetical protein
MSQKTMLNLVLGDRIRNKNTGKILVVDHYEDAQQAWQNRVLLAFSLSDHELKVIEEYRFDAFEPIQEGENS